VLANEDWQRAINELEAELLSCAARVLDCIERQAAVAARQFSTPGERNALSR